MAAVLHKAIGDGELAAFRTTAQQQRAFGSSAFNAMIEAKTQRFAGTRAAH